MIFHFGYPFGCYLFSIHRYSFNRIQIRYSNISQLWMEILLFQLIFSIIPLFVLRKICNEIQLEFNSKNYYPLRCKITEQTSNMADCVISFNPNAQALCTFRQPEKSFENCSIQFASKHKCKCRWSSSFSQSHIHTHIHMLWLCVCMLHTIHCICTYIKKNVLAFSTNLLISFGFCSQILLGYKKNINIYIVYIYILWQESLI